MANAQGAGVLANYDGWFKEVYSKAGIDNAIPEEALLSSLVPFKGGAERIGNKYHRPVRLADEQGITFSDGSGAPQMASAVAGQTHDAYIQSNEIASRGRLSYSAMSRSVDSASFGDVTSELITSLRRSTGKKLEVELMYGGSGIGAISAVTGNVLTIADAEFAPFIWAGQENMPITIRHAGTSINTYVTAVDLANKKITVADAGAAAAADVIYFQGAYGLEMVGLHKILLNTGTLFGIDASSWSVWQGNVHDLGGNPLSYAEILKGLYKAVSKGLTGDVTLLVSFATFQKMNSDVGAIVTNGARKIDASYNSDRIDVGQEGIRFFYQGGRVTVKPSGFVKEGYAYAIKPADYNRIGSTDVTFQIPGRPGRFVLDVQDYMAVEWRAYTDQALFTTKPAQGVLFKGITN